MRVTRRATLRSVGAAAAAGVGLAVTGCVGGPTGGQARQPITLRLLAEVTPGRQARVAAWNRRGGVALGANVVLDSLSGQPGPGLPPPPAAFLSALAADGQAGHVAWINLESVPLMAARRAIDVIGDRARRDRYDLKRFMPVGLQAGYALDGKLYALPEEVDAVQVFFNRTHLTDAGVDYRKAGFDFEEPDLSWESLRATNLDLASSPKSSGRLPFHPGHDAGPLEQWGWQNSGEWVADGGRRATFARPQNVEALTWLAAHARELAGAGVFTTDNFPAPARTGTSADDGGRHPFVAGRVTICFESTRFISTVAGYPVGADVGYVQVPQRYPGWRLMAASRGWGYAPLAGAPDAAWAALQFLVSEDAAIVDAEATQAALPRAAPTEPGLVSVTAGRARWYPPFTGQLALDRRLAAMFRLDNKRLDEGRDHALEQLRHGRLRPATLAPETVWTALADARRAVLTEQRAPLDALQEAERQVQARLDDAQAAAKTLS